MGELLGSVPPARCTGRAPGLGAGGCKAPPEAVSFLLHKHLIFVFPQRCRGNTASIDFTYNNRSEFMK